MTTTIDDLTEVDRDALQLAIDLTLLDDPPDRGRVEQVTDFLNGAGEFLPARPWREVAEFCAYHQQMRRLKLYSWSSSPCWIITEAEANAILARGPIPAADGSGKDISNCSSAELLKRMLRAGVSPYHPNPLAALVEAKRAKRRKDG
jgi:hypothetical protein